MSRDVIRAKCDDIVRWAEKIRRECGKLVDDVDTGECFELLDDLDNAIQAVWSEMCELEEEQDE